MLRGSNFSNSKLTTINSDCLVTPENRATTYRGPRTETAGLTSKNPTGVR